MAEGEAGAVAPIAETPVAAPAATPVPESTAEQVESPEGQQPEAAPEKTLTQSEVNKLIAKEKAQAEKRALKIARAEAERDLYKRQLEERTAQPAREQPQGRPRQEDFAGRPWDDYLDAVADWKFEQRMAKERETSQQKTTEQRQQRQAEENARYVHENIIAKGQAKYAEEFDRVFEVEGITEPMVASAADLPNGADVLFHLSTDDAERLRIAALRPAQQAFALKDLSAKLAAPPKPTQTPAPIRPTGGPASPVKSLSDLIGGSQEDFEKRRKAHLARK